MGRKNLPSQFHGSCHYLCCHGNLDLLPHPRVVLYRAILGAWSELDLDLKKPSEL